VNPANLLPDLMEIIHINLALAFLQIRAFFNNLNQLFEFFSKRAYSAEFNKPASTNNGAASYAHKL
jgi:hypothetical protein